MTGRYPLRNARHVGVHVVASLLITTVQLLAAETILWTFVGAVYRRDTPFGESLSMAFGVNFHSSLPTRGSGGQSGRPFAGGARERHGS